MTTIYIFKLSGWVHTYIYSDEGNSNIEAFIAIIKYNIIY